MYIYIYIYTYVYIYIYVPTIMASIPVISIMYVQEDVGLEKPQIRGWRAVSAARLQCSSLPERIAFHRPILLLLPLSFFTDLLCF